MPAGGSFRTAHRHWQFPIWERLRRQAEVRDLEDPSLSPSGHFVHHDVRGLQVTVNNVDRVQVQLETRSKLAKPRRRMHGHRVPDNM